MTTAKQDSDPIQILAAQLDELLAQRAELDGQIARHQDALAALRGTRAWSNRRSQTAGRALLAALASFKAPVSSQTLLDHDDLVHYSRHTLRSALSELHRTGQMRPVERTPKGFIWEISRGEDRK